MPTGTTAYKAAKSARTEVLDIDERLWDHIRLATSFIERQRGPSEPMDRGPSAVVVRRRGATPVVVVVMERQSATSGSAAADLCRRFKLSPRESEVALMLAQRMSCREIASRLGLSFHTARCYTEKILLKLDVRSKNEVRSRLGIIQ